MDKCVKFSDQTNQEQKPTHDTAREAGLISGDLLALGLGKAAQVSIRSEERGSEKAVQHLGAEARESRVGLRADPQLCFCL